MKLINDNSKKYVYCYKKNGKREYTQIYNKFSKNHLDFLGLSDDQFPHV